MEKYLKKSFKNNTFKMSGPICNKLYELPDGLYFIWEIPEYFEHIIKKRETVTGDPATKIFLSKIKKQNYI